MDLAAGGGFCNLYIELGHMTGTVNIKSYSYSEIHRSSEYRMMHDLIGLQEHGLFCFWILTTKMSKEP